MGAPFSQPLWSAQALIEAPQCVTQAHQGFIDAGAEIITVNSYACVPFHLEEFEWQLADGASAISYSFSANGEHFLVLDSLGFLNVLEAHAHDDHIHWELAGQVDITQEDVTTMPEGMKFSMTVAKNGQFAYVADPIAQHVVQVHLEDLEIEGELELTFPPVAITWLGIAQEEEHDHVH
ncbi:homocysteine S-methyltransferase family protein [Pseudoalteromonas sp. SM9913]|uniref:homocysteine S-methyltransferase family protein n=1 Tax=Pseudoalteromonas sp. (strain SM9913) TaxID=234831 RepID=UPI003FA42E42